MGATKEVTVVVGAGLTGLAAAWRLATSGQRCLLLEQRSTPGGLASTQILDDILFDFGPHFIFPDKLSPGGQLINELITKNEVLSGEFRYAIITNKHDFKMPIKGDILSYPFKYKRQIIANILTGSKSTAPAQSLRYFIESKFGKAYYDEVFKTMIKKKTGREGEDLHVDWYIRPERDFQNSPHTLLHANTKKNRILEPLKTFFSTNRYCYPKKGFGYIADQLFSRYETAGGQSIFECGDIELRYSKNRVTSCRVKETEIPIKNVIWAGSTNTLASLLPGDNKTTLPLVDTLILLLTFNGKRLQSNRYSYTYHPDKDIIFNRAYFPGNIFTKSSPKNKEGVCLEINWFNNIDSMAKGEIIQRALADAERLGFFKKKDLRHSRLIRLKESLPVYSLDYKQQLITQNNIVQKYRNLYAVGRAGGGFFCMSPAAVNQGLQTAEHTLNG